MSEMIERVARAIEVEFDKMIEVGTESFVRRAAIAAIEAMHEPTEAMLVAARDWSHRKYGKPIGNDAANGCWRAMIDAALGGEK